MFAQIEKKIQRNKKLHTLNTLAVPSEAAFFCVIETVEELIAGVKWAKANQMELKLIGGGSNIILPDKIDGIVLQINIKGFSCEPLIEQADARVLVTLGAGENWHECVERCTANGIYGLENLALIPGTVGAAPVQNIGAYGVEFEEVFHSLSAYDVERESILTFDKSMCEFAYRDSVFKKTNQNGAPKYIITSVVLTLSTVGEHIDNDYPALKSELADKKNISSIDVLNAVKVIRNSKLPAPHDIPNAGSFFKNPIISHSQYALLKKEYPALPSYAHSQTRVKIPAAWLIDHAGWKGTSRYGVAVHDNQALVLVNPNCKGSKEILQLARDIQGDIAAKFGIDLEREPVLF